MIISNSQIGISVQHQKQEDYQITEKHIQAQGEAPTNIEISAESQSRSSQAISISAAGSLLAMYSLQQGLHVDVKIEGQERINLKILEAMYEAITGHRLSDLATDDEASIAPSSDDNAAKKNAGTDISIAAPVGRVTAPATQKTVVAYQRETKYIEQESTTFNARGVVHTQDGKEIAISVDLTMSRQFMQASTETRSIITRGTQKIDPLVINFDGTGAQLTQTRFAFDLDADGKSESIANLQSGSGFLAIDRNNDGEINNGSELFGPTTGHGFEELKQYDDDNNNFIDEGDNIYSKLRIWTTNDDGSKQLLSLRDK